MKNMNAPCNTINVFPNIFINNHKKFFPKSCRTCSLIIDQNVRSSCIDSIELNTLRNKLYLCSPEMDLTINSEGTLCVKCLEIVNIVNRFICKYYKRIEKVNANFSGGFSSIQNFYSSEAYKCDVENEIKSEEIDLAETESFATTGLLSLPTTDKKYSVSQKYNSKTAKDGDFDCNIEWGKGFTWFHTKEVLYKSSQIHKRHLPKITVNKHTPMQLAKKTYKHLHNFKKISSINQRQNELTYNANKPFNRYRSGCSSIQEHKSKNYIHFCSAKTPFKCSKCDFSSTRKFSLQRHSRIHIGEKKFNCYYCDYSGIEKNYLISHLRTHMQETPFKCFHCNYNSTRKIILIRHIRTHTREKPFKCTYCDYQSNWRSQLADHTTTHTRQKSFKCSQCDYSSNRKSHLINHIRIHTGEKPFKCPHCDYRSIRNNQLMDHIRIHTGEKPFKCSKCDYNSTWKSQLIHHINTHIDEKPFKCSDCNYTSTWKSCLVRHIRTHMRKKPFKCSYCDYSSSWKYQLRNHIRTHV